MATKLRHVDTKLRHVDTKLRHVDTIVRFSEIELWHFQKMITQGCASLPQPGGRFPPTFGNFPKLGGNRGGEFF